MSIDDPTCKQGNTIKENCLDHKADLNNNCDDTEFTMGDKPLTEIKYRVSEIQSV